MTSQNKLNIALCGSGRIGRVHAANIAAHPGVNLAWVADPVIDSAREVAGLYSARATGSTDDVFADASLDAVVVCSPTPTHIDLIRAAVGRGLAVLCEKPIDLDIDRVRSCLADLAGNTAAVMMGFNRRFDPAFAAVRKRVAAGQIGRLEQLTITSRDPAPAPAAYIAASGGIFRDMSIHDLDMARFFIPDVVEVTAHGANVFSDYIAEAGDFDSAVITLRGAERGTGHASRTPGTAPTATTSGWKPSAARACCARTTFHPPRSAASARLPSRRPTRTSRSSWSATPQPTGTSWTHFVDAIRAGIPCFPGFEDGMAALVLADAAAESAATGKTVSVEGALHK